MRKSRKCRDDEGGSTGTLDLKTWQYEHLLRARPSGSDTMVRFACRVTSVIFPVLLLAAPAAAAPQAIDPEEIHRLLGLQRKAVQLIKECGKSQARQTAGGWRRAIV